MKVVDRDAFLAMPEGTVFCRIQFRDPGPNERAYSSSGWDSSFDIENPEIKGETVGNDFYCLGVGDFQPKEGNTDDVLSYICEHNGEDIPFEITGHRDGLFDDTHVYFAIYSFDEVRQMISELLNALEKAYN